MPSLKEKRVRVQLLKHRVIQPLTRPEAKVLRQVLQMTVTILNQQFKRERLSAILPTKRQLPI
jgi:hypothetical protein